MSNTQRIKRYCHTHSDKDQETLLKLITDFKPKHLMWCGTDLMYVNERETGRSFMTVIETNSCASGQKSNPLYDENVEDGGYGTLLRHCFIPELHRRSGLGLLPEGNLGVIYDKNLMEASGYAAALADALDEEVHLIPVWNEDVFGPHVTKWENNVLYFLREGTAPIPIRAVFRYVTQKPWQRLPVDLPSDSLSTFVCNPVIACLAGGRNKMVAAKAYDNFNIELSITQLPVIRTPTTIRDVKFEDVRKWIKRLGGFGCIKVPYSNAGQGVYTVTNERELCEFEESEKNNMYSLYIIQSLIANSQWSSKGHAAGALDKSVTLYHNGTIPNKKGNIFVADLRLQVCANPVKGGFMPVAMYARRAHKPLANELDENSDTWAQLGTNLSVVQGEGLFSTEAGRLLLMDRKDFDTLGLGIDSLIDAYVQACLCHIAIDRMAEWLNEGEKFNEMFFRSVCNDDKLLEEIAEGNRRNSKTSD